MKKKLLGVISLICLLMFSFSSDALAAINSQAGINNVANKLMQVSTMDIMSFVNKSDLVGYRYNNFQMQTDQYKRSITSTITSLESISNRISIIKNSIDYSDSEKDMQTRQLYQEVDTAVNNVNTLTINYLIGIKQTMPTITYQKFLKRFQEYYNGLNIDSNYINVI